jgi:lipopolysaccharide export system protein LptA
MLLRGRGFSGRTQLREATVQRDVEVVLNPTEQELSPALGGGQPGASKQVTITCDGPLSLDYERNIATFHQNVHVVDPSGDLYSDTLVAYLNPQTHTIRYAEAIGRVRIHQQRNTATSERAVYEPAIAKITLLGQPSLLLFPDDSGPEAAPSFGGLAAMSVPRGAPGEAEAGARR